MKCMTIRMTLAVGCCLLLGQPLWAQNFNSPKVADAKRGDVRVIATAAIREPLDAVAAQAEKKLGRHLVIEYGSARGNLKQEILAGQEFEVAILLPDVNDVLHQQGKATPGAFEIARVPVAIAVRGDAPDPDVSTPAALKSAMLNAKSVVYAPTGAALMTVKKILTTLNIADSIHDSSAASAPVALAPGEYEINLFPLSEIIPNKTLRNLGPVIPELQVPVVISAVIGERAQDARTARALIRFLQGPSIDAALKADGMVKGEQSSGATQH